MRGRGGGEIGRYRERKSPWLLYKYMYVHNHIAHPKNEEAMLSAYSVLINTLHVEWRGTGREGPHVLTRYSKA